GEAARFLKKSEQPFEAAALHPARRLPSSSAVKVEGGADSDHQSAIELRYVIRHEAFLLGRAQADPDDVGPTCRDLLLPRDEFLVGQCAKRRCESADDVQAGETREQGATQFLGDAGFPAVEIMT